MSPRGFKQTTRKTAKAENSPTIKAVCEDEKFEDFGDDSLLPLERQTGLRRIDGVELQDLRADVRRFVPRAPGCYGMIDTLGRLVYVGKSKSLRSRLLSYFSANKEEDKAGRIIETSNAIVWETQPTEFASLVREQSLIRAFEPRFNVQGLPKRQLPQYVHMGRGPVETLYTSRTPDPNASYSLGPIFGATRTARAVEVLNRIYQLRDCSSKQACSFSDQLQLFELELRPGCIRLELQTCLGPCIAACSRSKYEESVARATSFLKGIDTSPLAILTAKMQVASENLQYEAAAILREDLAAVSWLSRRAVDIANARHRFQFVYAPNRMDNRKQASGTKSGTRLWHASENGDFESHAAQPVWYLIRGGMLEGAVAAPRNTREQRTTRELLKTWYTREPSTLGAFTARQETLPLVASWFRQNPKELQKTFLPGITRAPRTLVRQKRSPSSA